MGFEEFELKIRQQRARMLGPVGFEPAEDIADMTVSAGLWLRIHTQFAERSRCASGAAPACAGPPAFRAPHHRQFRRRRRGFYEPID